jgi:hypothetical protein
MAPSGAMVLTVPWFAQAFKSAWCAITRSGQRLGGYPSWGWVVMVAVGLAELGRWRLVEGRLTLLAEARCVKGVVGSGRHDVVRVYLRRHTVSPVRRWVFREAPRRPLSEGRNVIHRATDT